MIAPFYPPHRKEVFIEITESFSFAGNGYVSFHLQHVNGR